MEYSYEIIQSLSRSAELLLGQKATNIIIDQPHYIVGLVDDKGKRTNVFYATLLLSESLILEHREKLLDKQFVKSLVRHAKFTDEQFIFEVRSQIGKQLHKAEQEMSEINKVLDPFVQTPKEGFREWTRRYDYASRVELDRLVKEKAKKAETIKKLREKLSRSVPINVVNLETELLDSINKEWFMATRFRWDGITHLLEAFCNFLTNMRPGWEILQGGYGEEWLVRMGNHTFNVDSKKLLSPYWEFNLYYQTEFMPEIPRELVVGDVEQALKEILTTIKSYNKESIDRKKQKIFSIEAELKEHYDCFVNGKWYNKKKVDQLILLRDKLALQISRAEYLPIYEKRREWLRNYYYSL